MYSIRAICASVCLSIGDHCTWLASETEATSPDTIQYNVTLIVNLTEHNHNVNTKFE